MADQDNHAVSLNHNDLHKAFVRRLTDHLQTRVQVRCLSAAIDYCPTRSIHPQLCA